MSTRNEKIIGEGWVCIVRRPHRFRTTVKLFGDVYDAFMEYGVWDMHTYFENWNEFLSYYDIEKEDKYINKIWCELQDNELNANDSFEICYVGGDEYVCACADELSLLEYRVKDDMYMGHIFISEEGETWGEFADRIYEETRGHNEPSMAMIESALGIEE